MKTFTATPADISHDWHVVDAEGVPLGRLASVAVKVFMSSAALGSGPSQTETDSQDSESMQLGSSGPVVSLELQQHLPFLHRFPGCNPDGFYHG